jgi:hypothetical protein
MALCREGCGRVARSRGWCSSHYRRWPNRFGDDANHVFPISTRERSGGIISFGVLPLQTLTTRPTTTLLPLRPGQEPGSLPPSVVGLAVTTPASARCDHPGPRAVVGPIIPVE